ncbi:ATP-binding cassette transporter abc4 [Phlyctema vagabunda]|uniref:ATP-binding cassette transporter abc4 n=1 Tax=Phlyctema vagabunda TaxID=108571 RepID=A0ABR4P431_9HELO
MESLFRIGGIQESQSQYSHHVVKPFSSPSDDRIQWEDVVLRLSEYLQTGNAHLAILFASLLLIGLSFAKESSLLYIKSRKSQTDSRRGDVVFLYKKPLVYDIVNQAIIGTALILSILLSSQGPVLEAAVLGYTFVLRCLHIFVSRRQHGVFRLIFGVHSILLLVSSTLLSFSVDILPTLLIHRHIRSTPLQVTKTLMLVTSLAVLMVSPRNAIKKESSTPTSNNVAKMEELEEKLLVSPAPEEYCSPVSYFMSYSWLDKLILVGWRRALALDDLPPLPHYDEPFIWLDNVLEARKRGISTMKTVLILMRWELLAQMTFAALTAVVEFIPPFAMNRLLSYLDDPENSVFHPAVWVLLLFLGPMARSFSYQQYIFNSTRLVVRVRSSFVQEIYHKALGSIIFEKVPIEEKEKNSQDVENPSPEEVPVEPESDVQDVGDSGVGHIINLMSFDVHAIEQARDIVWVSVAVPIEVTISMVFLYRLIGWSSMAGLMVMILSLSLPSIISRQMMMIQRKVMERSDIRISSISEYLSSIRIIKYFGWEKPMVDKIKEMRRVEQLQIWKRKMWAVASVWAGDFIPLFTLFIMFVTFTAGTGQPLRAATAFTCLSVIETLRQQFMRIADVTAYIAEALTSFKRVDTFFRTVIPKTEVSIGEPALKAATFLRSPGGNFRLRDIDVEFLPGQLNVVTGPTGCGKTSLLLSLLGETILESGEVTCPRDVAHFDQDRYDATVKACGLLRDLEELPHGDLTQVAEQGAVLSGGQQQRVALARAVYSSASTLLLDDVFSALDIHTTNLIYNEFFKNGFLGERTVILVSHLPALIDAASLVVRIEAGRVVETSKKTSTVSTSTNPELEEAHEPSEAAALPTDRKPTILKNNKLEESAKGRVPRGLFFQYILCFGGYPYAILALATSFSAQAAFFSITLWLSVWTGAYSKSEAVNIGFYISVYAAILFGFNFMVALNNGIFQYGSWRAASNLHTKLLDGVFNVPIRWFDSQAIGTILNRFSTDMQILDSNLVNVLRMTLDLQIRLCLRIGGIASIMPIFALPAAIFCSVGFMIGEMYTRTQISIKRLTSTTQSPIFAHFSESLIGLPTIRAQSGMKDVFGLILADRVRRNSRAFEALYNSNRWVSVRADAVAATVAASAGIIAIVKAQTISAGLVGFSLTNAIGLSQTILAMVRTMNELEVELNSFQRVLEYTNLKSETEEYKEHAIHSGNPDKTITPPASWPSQGEVKLEGFSASYSHDGPNVLKNISLHARPGERIGIVGRTGSGKSSLGLSLLRFTHKTSGAIFIDGIDISKLALSDLRRSVTIIPQEPTLFAGDVRTNLDPFNEQDETDLNAALKACNFTINDTSISSSSSSTSSATEPTITLTTPVATDGSNFSRGQRQILSMARAICRRSKIVLLDEATSSVDDATDEQIQRVLRTEFPGSTVFTIAHRLKTVMDYDRIIVLSDGRIVEVGTPKELSEKSEGVFGGMVREMGNL